MKHEFSLAVTLLALTMCAASAPLTYQSKAKNPTQISTERIGGDIELTGYLGKVLGTTVEVSGQWHYPASDGKDYSIRFTVKSLDGMTLANPVEFNVAQLRIADDSGMNQIPDYKHHKQLEGKQWTFMAYETGRITVSPKWYDKSHVPGSIAAPYYTKPFTPILVGRIERTKESQK